MRRPEQKSEARPGFFEELTPIHLGFVGLGIEIRSNSPDANAFVTVNFSALRSEYSKEPDLVYEITEIDKGFVIRRSNSDAPVELSARHPAEFLYVLEKDLVIECQKLRPDLYFLHAAALSYRDTAFLLVAPSGGGKSTTCWGLVNHGCHYLSDELAPTRLQDFQVHPFPHALCLKSEPEPPSPYRLPKETLNTGPTLHIPTEAFPVRIVNAPIPLGVIFHIQHLSMDLVPSTVEISAAQSAALLYANALNPLSHARAGLDAAVDIARHARNFQTFSGPLDLTVAEILSTLEKTERR